MRALFADAAVFQHDDAIGIANGGQAMGDNKRRSFMHQAFERITESAFTFVVERACGFVQDDQRRILEEDPRDAQALPLPGG